VILLTGFEPFGGYKHNPSAEVAEALHRRTVGDVAIYGAILPVHHARAAALVNQLVRDVAPRAIVHLGLAGGRARLALERVAVNVMDFEIADNAGYRAAGEPCVAGGPAAYFSTLPLEAIQEALGAQGVPAYLSSSAGTYLCNQTFYTTRHLLESRGLRTPAGFIHLPPALPLAMLVRGVTLAIEATLTPEP